MQSRVGVSLPVVVFSYYRGVGFLYCHFCCIQNQMFFCPYIQFSFPPVFSTRLYRNVLTHIGRLVCVFFLHKSCYMYRICCRDCWYRSVAQCPHSCEVLYHLGCFKNSSIVQRVRIRLDYYIVKLKIFIVNFSKERYIGLMSRVQKMPLLCQCHFKGKYAFNAWT